MVKKLVNSTPSLLTSSLDLLAISLDLSVELDSSLKLKLLIKENRLCLLALIELG